MPDTDLVELTKELQQAQRALDRLRRAFDRFSRLLDEQIARGLLDATAAAHLLDRRDRIQVGL